jgi:hypothetical protein
VQQKEGGRVRGLRARFWDDSIQVLGCWDPSKGPDAFTTIYSADTDVKLESVAFVMCHLKSIYPQPNQIVKEIVVNGDYNMDQANIFIWERLAEVWRRRAIPTLMLTR